MFCPKCGSLLFPAEGKFACARCGYERTIGAGESKVARVVNRDERPSEMLILDEVMETLPRTRVDCPKCGNGEAFWVMRQTRAADEPTTRIYRCTKCSHTWREY
ncbi:MAG TPA: transcription factor S [Thermoplasmata archaeon]|jgi:DNA-directed RNA polymerase subunit M|nr:transcription factor S [Thermoplasmata archaeon]